MSREVTMPQGRHRPQTYTLPLVSTWEACRTAYTKPSLWRRLLSGVTLPSGEPRNRPVRTRV